MRRIIHGVEINTEAKTLTFKHTCLDEMDIYRLTVAVKVMGLIEYLAENYINSDAQLYQVALEAREELVGNDATLSDDEAISLACEHLGIVLIAKDNVSRFDNPIETAS